MKRIEGRAKTIREVLGGIKYSIDFYQREYAWKEREVRELVDDLVEKFLDFYQDDHQRSKVQDYGHYFLGPIVISHKRGKRYIVDGQQRLTTLTLLFILLHHLQSGLTNGVDVRDLIFSVRYGRRSFNLDVDEREGAMQALLDGATFDPEGKSESVQNLIARHDFLAEILPDRISAGRPLPFFVDWLCENVHVVEIEAYSDEDAYTIFETMNDRGLPLSLPDMLKGYVLANISHEDDQRRINTIWKRRIQAFRDLGKSEDVDFFKNWLRARHAETLRPSRSGAENQDYERIGTEFHRWIRDRHKVLGLQTSADFIRFVERDLDFYGRHALAIRQAAVNLVPDWESIRYNEDRKFTLQYQVMLAALSPDDTPVEVSQKIALVADYFDIWITRRAWNFRTTDYSAIKHRLFNYTREIRNLSLGDLSAFLRRELDEQRETFAREPEFRLHGNNYRNVKHILARLTHWLDTQCGRTSSYDDLVSIGRSRPFEVEHLWANRFDRFTELFSTPDEFTRMRQRLGAMVLLQRGLNQSLGDKTYEEKRDAYVTHGQNLLAQSLHPEAYRNNPALTQLLNRTGLPLRPYDHFGLEELQERQELYLRIAEWVWNPSRLDLDGVQPPIHEPLRISEPEPEPPSGATAERYRARYRFWERLLGAAHASSDLHAKISPAESSWIGAQRHWLFWIYTVLQHTTRVELYIDRGEGRLNKEIFDHLENQRSTVEESFGGPLRWQRLDDRRASRISHTVTGGWADESSWDEAIGAAVPAMDRLYAALAPLLPADLQ